MPPVGFERAVLASERPQTHESDRTSVGIGSRRKLQDTNEKLNVRSYQPSVTDVNVKQV